MQLKVKRLDSRAMIPDYQTEGAACFDFHAIDGGDIPPKCSHNFPTGLSFEVPPGYVMLMHSRSGHGFKHGVRLVNCTGVIDSDYRGEVGIKLHNDGFVSHRIQPGDRIAQGMLVPIPTVKLVEVEDLTETKRGTAGFGSTGV